LTLFCRETAAFGLESGAETLPFASEIAGAPFAGFVVCS
jgi:hypothetical protein